MASKAGETGLAARYALALFDLADERKALDQVAEDLTKVESAIAGSAALQRLVRNPVLSRAEQGKAMAALLKQMDAGELTQDFVGLVAANRRLFALRSMIQAFLGELSRRRGEVTAEVTSARKLDAGQTGAIEDALKKVVGRKVALSIDVDPGLIGGLVVKVGSRMIDSSVRTQLQKMRIAMKGAG